MFVSILLASGYATTIGQNHLSLLLDIYDCVMYFVLRHFSPVHILKPHACKTNFNCILSSILVS
jgi:hypothetical protein